MEWELHASKTVLQGFEQQAVKLMLKYRFEFLGMERICAKTLSMNVGAPKALEKCGFILEGREREAVYLNGRKYDRLNYAILKSEYIDQMPRMAERLALIANIEVVENNPEGALDAFRIVFITK